jgi:hypothetical protein
MISLVLIRRYPISGILGRLRPELSLPGIYDDDDPPL